MLYTEEDARSPVPTPVLSFSPAVSCSFPSPFIAGWLPMRTQTPLSAEGVLTRHPRRRNSIV